MFSGAVQRASIARIVFVIKLKSAQYLFIDTLRWRGKGIMVYFDNGLAVFSTDLILYRSTLTCTMGNTRVNE